MSVPEFNYCGQPHPYRQVTKPARPRRRRSASAIKPISPAELVEIIAEVGPQFTDSAPEVPQVGGDQ